MTAWIGNVLILFSALRLGNKCKDGWLWSIVGNAFWTYFGVRDGIWSVVFINGLMGAIAFRNWLKWRNGSLDR